MFMTTKKALGMAVLLLLGNSVLFAAKGGKNGNNGGGGNEPPPPRDQGRIATTRYNTDSSTTDLVLHDLDTGTQRTLIGETARTAYLEVSWSHTDKIDANGASVPRWILYLGRKGYPDGSVWDDQYTGIWAVPEDDSQPPHEVLVLGADAVPAWARLPRLSPDDQWLAYHRRPFGSSHEGSVLVIQQFDVATGTLTPGGQQFVARADGPLIYDIAWSPDGRSVAFRSTSSPPGADYTEREIYRVDLTYAPDGLLQSASHPYPIADTPNLNGFHFDWSAATPAYPEGLVIAGMTERRSGSRGQLNSWSLLIDPATRAVVGTMMDGTSFYSWSPNGTRIAFTQGHQPDWIPDIFAADREGTRVARLTASPESEKDCAWRPAPFLDCNNNGLNDSVDIASGTSSDADPDGVPDECQQ